MVCDGEEYETVFVFFENRFIEWGIAHSYYLSIYKFFTWVLRIFLENIVPTHCVSKNVQLKKCREEQIFEMKGTIQRAPDVTVARLKFLFGEHNF